MTRWVFVIRELSELRWIAPRIQGDLTITSAAWRIVMIQPNTAFFHPRQSRAPRVGLRQEPLFNYSGRAIQPGILLGSKEPLKLIDADKNDVEAFGARKGSQVIWTHDGQELEATPEGLVLNASIVSVPTNQGGTRHFLTHPVGDGKHLVFIQTGLTGRVEDHVRQVLEASQRGQRPVFHGTLPLDDGSRELARHIRWWRPRTKLPTTENIPARRMDLYELSEGAELLVGDIFAGHECRIVVRDGMISREDIPTAKARDALDLYGHKLSRRTRKRANAASKRRLLRRENLNPR